MLCAVFGEKYSQKPLSLGEYSSIVSWLKEIEKTPSYLLQKENIIAAAKESGINKQRLELLLGRGVQLGFTAEKWEREGVWVISRSDADYPMRYKKQLKHKAPPILFGVGDRKLLNGGGLAIVGSRNANEDSTNFAKEVAEICVKNKMPVVSGAARGIDLAAMTSALDAGGITIGVLAHDLLKNSVQRRFRHAIADGKLVLLSPHHPNARFNVGTIMARNKLIYAIADYGLVVSSDYKKGGTWAGAEEQLHWQKLPIFIRSGNNTPQGNHELLNIDGAIQWPASVDINNLKQQLQQSTATISTKSDTETEPDEDKAISVYEMFLPTILNKLSNPTRPKELIKILLDVSQKQIEIWLKKAEEEGKIIKSSKKPIQYQRAGIENSLKKESESLLQDHEESVSTTQIIKLLQNMLVYKKEK